MLKLGILISGSGSNLQAIIDAIAAGTLDAEIVTVISNKADAYGLERACHAGIRAVHLDPADPAYRGASDSSTPADKAAATTAYNAAIRDELTVVGADYVVMAGYMKLLGLEVLDAYPNRVLNLHPALLPSFPGAHGIDDALAYGVKITGVTVHFADAEFDRGPIIAQIPVEVREDDTADTLATRIHAAEHTILPKALQWIAEGRVTVEGRRVYIS
ncbi:MAG: phosphoribosylglycinamide formyltransferase [Coriobacteriia bacterium]|nr:phosphoribosylglycinamide formyltransferase [Coriobacteriia bacterium]